MGYKVDNDIFAQNSWYFRNALVRANYQNLPAGVERTTEFLELFFRNLLMGEHNELKNRYLHIRWKSDEPRVSEEMSNFGLEERAKSVQESTQKIAKGTQKTLESSQKSSQKIIEMMAANPYITTEVISEKLGVTRRAVAKQIAKLKERGIVLRVGPDKGGHWEVVK